MAAAEIEGGLDEGWGDQTLGPADFNRALAPRGGSWYVDVSGSCCFWKAGPPFMYLILPALSLDSSPARGAVSDQGYSGNPGDFHTQRPAGESGAQRRPS